MFVRQKLFGKNSIKYLVLCTVRVVGLCHLRFNLRFDFCPTASCRKMKMMLAIFCFELKVCVQPEDKKNVKMCHRKLQLNIKTALNFFVTNLKTVSNPKGKQNANKCPPKHVLKIVAGCVVEQILLSRFWLKYLSCPAAQTCTKVHPIPMLN